MNKDGVGREGRDVFIIPLSVRRDVIEVILDLVESWERKVGG
jgi:hypothetical protein